MLLPLPAARGFLSSLLGCHTSTGSPVGQLDALVTPPGTGRDLRQCTGKGEGASSEFSVQTPFALLHQVTHQLQNIKDPITSALSAVCYQEWFTAKLLPKWHELNELDHFTLLDATNKQQNDTSIALCCIQAQT